MPVSWNHKVFGVNPGSFEALALEVFHFQYENNPVYAAYVHALGINPGDIYTIGQIPFLPVSFFKSQDVSSTVFSPAAVFESSGTTGTIHSRHPVKDLSWYEESFAKGFEFFYGPVKEWCVIGLLPSYLERKNSSLVYMAEKLIQWSGHPKSGFYLDEHEKLFALLQELEKRQQKTLLIGVTFALLDFAEKYSIPLKHTVVMETGGMKGRREEMIREEVHAILKKSFSLGYIHSEYGMTELLSQAYSKGKGVFHCPPWMRVMVRDEEDPLFVKSFSGSREPGTEFTIHHSPITTLAGAINIIDLANIYSCSFLATDDAGRLYPDGGFEVLGRIDGSDLRGCSLLVV